MGNINSTEDVYKYKREALKKIYSMNASQLLELQMKLKEEREKNIRNKGLLHDNELQRLLVNELRQDQAKLQGKIEYSLFNTINTFLTNVSRDINTFVPNTSDNYSNNNNSSSVAGHRKRKLLPHEILKIPANYTLEQLKRNYKKMALEFHPDRNPNGTQIFEAITDAYMECIESLKMRQQDKTCQELKTGAREFRENQEAKPMMNQNMVGKTFSQEKFNQMFQEHRTARPEDNGYKDWLNEHENKSEEPEYDPQLVGNFSSRTFNESFNRRVKPCKNEIVEYKNPRELFTGGSESCETLGETEIKNFSGHTKSIHYTDLREAHTKTRLVDPSKVDISNRPKNISAMKSHRGKRIEDYTEAEWTEIQAAQLEEQKREETRQINLKNTDESAFIKYDKIHKLMLTNVYQ